MKWAVLTGVFCLVHLQNPHVTRDIEIVTRNILLLICCTIIVTLIISACGQKGSLYIPNENQPDKQLQERTS
ncbi:MAG: lipoprotein [Candidatus Thiodiazotropha sp. (ex Ustalcina ferruginea)]|nr:lipoprotein [Candidatus Thiodiazotropha sp. (ex Ustalcina ferruginea)]